MKHRLNFKYFIVSIVAVPFISLNSTAIQADDQNSKIDFDIAECLKTNNFDYCYAKAEGKNPDPENLNKSEEVIPAEKENDLKEAEKADAPVVGDFGSGKTQTENPVKAEEQSKPNLFIISFLLLLVLTLAYILFNKFKKTESVPEINQLEYINLIVDLMNDEEYEALQYAVMMEDTIDFYFNKYVDSDYDLFQSSNRLTEKIIQKTANYNLELSDVETKNRKFLATGTISPFQIDAGLLLLPLKKGAEYSIPEELAKYFIALTMQLQKNINFKDEKRILKDIFDFKKNNSNENNFQLLNKKESANEDLASIIISKEKSLKQQQAVIFVSASQEYIFKSSLNPIEEFEVSIPEQVVESINEMVDDEELPVIDNTTDKTEIESILTEKETETKEIVEYKAEAQEDFSVKFFDKEYDVRDPEDIVLKSINTNFYFVFTQDKVELFIKKGDELEPVNISVVESKILLAEVYFMKFKNQSHLPSVQQLDAFSEITSSTQKISLLMKKIKGLDVKFKNYNFERFIKDITTDLDIILLNSNPGLEDDLVQLILDENIIQGDKFGTEIFQLFTVKRRPKTTTPTELAEDLILKINNSLTPIVKNLSISPNVEIEEKRELRKKLGSLLN